MKAGGVLVVALLAAGCASSASTGGGDVRGWLTANASGIRQMRGAAANLEVVMGGTDPRGPYCAQVATQVELVERALPSPDKTLTRLIHAAAEDYGFGAAAALNGGPQAAALLVRGDREIRQAVDRSKRLGRSIY